MKDNQLVTLSKSFAFDISLREKQIQRVSWDVTERLRCHSPDSSQKGCRVFVSGHFRCFRFAGGLLSV